MNKIFTELCKLASYGLFKVAKEIEEADIEEEIYNEDELLRIES